jgi:PAS domain S-box-containing protein
MVRFLIITIIISVLNAPYYPVEGAKMKKASSPSKFDEFRSKAEEMLKKVRAKAAVALQQSGSMYRELVENANSAIIRWKSDGTIIFFNEYAQKFFGYRENEIIGEHVGILVPEKESTGGDLTGLVQDIVSHPERHIQNINENIRSDGGRAWMAWTNKPVLDENGRVAEIMAIGTDITESKRMEEKAARLAAIVQSSHDAVIGKNLDGEITSWNRAAEIIYGYTAEEAIFQSISILIPLDIHDEFPAILQQISRGEVVEHFETRHRRKNGKVIDVSLSISPIKNAPGQIVGASTIARDISEQRRFELERQITAELLLIINNSAGTADLMKAVATFFQRQSGCEAVGIRLKEGDDFPYFEARGFPEEFVRLENNLCARDAFGNVLRDSSGNPFIECMCGNVILERVDLSKPFFSPGGSFWANDTTRLLATTSDEDRQTRTRNRCNGAGYESVALMPLRVGKERLGLIQLNDRRKGMFSPATIALWEKLAGYLAIALAKSRNDESLRMVPSMLIQAQENERQRLAVELHDSIGQTVVALKFRIEHVITTLENREYNESLRLLNEYVPILQRSIDETRAIYMGLRPTVLSEHGIISTLEWYRYELTKLYPDQHVELELEIGETDIPDDLKITVFRIVQEALNNSFKHGKPEWVDVRLSLKDGSIELEIKDDGVGMDLDFITKSHTAKSLGLMGMKERTELTGGQFTIESAVGEGTTVKAVWRNPS